MDQRISDPFFVAVSDFPIWRVAIEQHRHVRFGPITEIESDDCIIAIGFCFVREVVEKQECDNLVPFLAAQSRIGTRYRLRQNPKQAQSAAGDI